MSDRPRPDVRAEEQLGNTQGFESRELVRLFEIIDRLRECGVSEDISLPQLVVVGDQSSGKSSVLEALTSIPFPVASTLCTRFATQINFRRTAHERVTITITPNVDSSSSRTANLKAFSKHFTTLTAELFSDVLEQASEAMGLPKPGVECTDTTAGARFSDDVLKIELCGPMRPHFSVVDVPGIFQSETPYQTEEDIVFVENMVVRYLREPRTIILAVASALNETANQKIFRLAKEADPKGSRTVGLLTKPDAVQAGDEARVMDVARNRVTQLTHGWFVVRNRSTEEVRSGVTAERRLKNEQTFFQTDPWRSLDKNRVGIQALERFLRNLLYEHVRREYPILVKELENKVFDLRQAIDDLGSPRESPEQQRSVLIEVATKFQIMARDALMGIYREEHEDDSMRLRTNVRNLNDDFANNVKFHGHLYNFETEDPKKIHAWILKVHKRSRGVELDGLVNYDVFKSLFRSQTEGWEQLAREHISVVNQQVNEFISRLLNVKCHDSELRLKLASFLGPHFSRTFDNASEELNKILRSERGEVMLTYDDSFVKTLDEIRQQRMLDDLSKNQCIESDSEGQSMFSMQGLISIFHSSYKTREEQAVHEIYDYLKSYYYAARTRFIDCVCLQVIERHFLGEGGSVQAFSPALVGKMSPEELQGIAGEDFSVVSTRHALVEKLERLETARAIANAGYV
ncbi:P-loop containing nucleoside triphosphate hydrolase protein [Wilcoxina mikolae CBS 423.85]|nr:P-loop containing nucleoside triphosphate hydrolase protein [Wilcoxina mikolae CBS 423.85]